MRILFSVLSLAAIVGCASQAPTPVATAAPVQVASAASEPAGIKQVCTKETVVGTSFPQTVCRSVSTDPNNLDVARNVEDLNRTNGFQQGTLSRGGIAH